MYYTIEHLYASTTEDVSVTKVSDATYQVTHFSTGELPIRHPGTFNILKDGWYFVRPWSGSGPDVPKPVRGNTPIKTALPLTVTIFTPDGLEFPRDYVTVEDLNRFRDLRNASHAAWRYDVRGDSGPTIDSDDPRGVTPGQAVVRIAIEESVPSQSAGPLVNHTIESRDQIFSFDLFRVGEFQAKVASRDRFALWKGTLRLKNPDGTVVASSANGQLNFPVTLSTINSSRDPAGNVRQWSLEIETANAAGFGSNVTATVIASACVNFATIQKRIDALLGPGGGNFSIWGANRNGRVLCRFRVNDPYTAETLDYDFKDFAKDLFGKIQQDSSIDTDHPEIQPHVEYNLANRNQQTYLGLNEDASGIKVTAIQITIGPSQYIQPPIPAITVEVDLDGEVDVNADYFTLFNVAVDKNRAILELGIKLDTAGNITPVTFINVPVVLKENWEAAVLAGVIGLAGGPIGVVLGETGLAAVTEGVETFVVAPMVDGFTSTLETTVAQASRIMPMLLGANFDLTAIRLDGDGFVIDYVAPVEPDPKPNPFYTGIIGRSVTQAGPGKWQVVPKSLGDTWAAPNLKSKIGHIVVVMMENRSFDHVLGYRTLLLDAQGGSGLSQELLNFLAVTDFTFNQDGNTITVKGDVSPLSLSNIEPNAAGLKTRFPVEVGHELADLARQLGAKLQMPTGQWINSPQGFLDDFAPRLADSGLGVLDGLKVTDVLGYYTNTDLAMYGFLAQQFAYCERYFCSHPGPTLPNRMYSLSGGVQYDRTGEPVLDTNNGDNFWLSRALNIFDLLTRKGIEWRVYESFPSLTMLRMFARYVTDETNIRDISRLEADIGSGDIPQVVFIDPALHSEPENDDHPPYADMLLGQQLIKRVYDTFRFQREVWEKTLLLVTYDEHGGFYDHMIPPVADALSMPPQKTGGGGSGQTISFKTDMTISYGLRVPAFVVSPWTPPGKGPDVTLDHCSILKTILARFCGDERPFLTDRVNASQSFDAFLSLADPRLDVVPSPDLPYVFVPKNPLSGRAIIGNAVPGAMLAQGEAETQDLFGILARLLGRK